MLNMRDPQLGSFRQDIEGRDFDPNVLFRLQNPDMVYRDETVTTPEEYENIKALRELQQIQSPMDFELEDAPELYGVIPQVSGEKTLDEILNTLDEERTGYEQAALDRYIKENPYSVKYYRPASKPRQESKKPKKKKVDRRINYVPKKKPKGKPATAIA
jgi:hypothetical protein